MLMVSGRLRESTSETRARVTLRLRSRCLPQCSLGLALATRLRGWCGEGPAHGFGFPIYDHEEGARGDVGLAATFTSNRLAAVIFY